jgi:hypothetical protein
MFAHTFTYAGVFRILQVFSLLLPLLHFLLFLSSVDGCISSLKPEVKQMQRRSQGFEYDYWKIHHMKPDDAKDEAIMLIGGKNNDLFAP